MSCIAIIPARGGSKRIKNKNIVEFCGRPLISYSLEAAKGAGVFDEIHVSTDDPQIREVVASLGFPPLFLRDPALADDHTPIMPVLRWTLERYKERGLAFDAVCLVMASAPLIQAEDLRAAYDVYRRHDGQKSLLSVCPYSVPIEWAFDYKDDGRLVPVRPGAFKIRSQDLRKKYHDTGTFAIFPTARVLSATPPDDRDFIAYVLTKDKAVDIDDPEDLALAHALYLGRSSK